MTPGTVAQSGFSVHGDFPSKNTGVGCHFLLQGIFLTQGSNLGLPHFRQMLYHQGDVWATREISTIERSHQTHSYNIQFKIMGLELRIERSYQTYSHNIHFKMTELVRRFLRREMSSSRIHSCYIITGTEFIQLLYNHWYWEGLGAGGEGDDRGWDGWMASPTQWPWVWVNSRSWWWTGRPGVLRFMGLQRVRHDWVTELTDRV